MKIHIQTFTGDGRPRKIDVAPSTTIKQLLERLCRGRDLKKIYLVYDDEVLADDDVTLEEYDLPDGSILDLVDFSVTTRGGGFGFLGKDFADVSNNKGLKKRAWSKKAPQWRRATNGLNLDGVCINEQCQAYNQRVVIPIGYKTFDVVAGSVVDTGNDLNVPTAICPMCKGYVEAQTCGFNNCWWKYEGLKQDEAGKPPKKCSNDWQYVGDAYHYFDEKISGVVNWRKLVIKAVKDKP